VFSDRIFQKTTAGENDHEQKSMGGRRAKKYQGEKEIDVSRFLFFNFPFPFFLIMKIIDISE
jgi:hypothetical protein